MFKYNCFFQVLKGQLINFSQVRPFQLPEINLQDALLKLNRNARAPKNANHGKRPCSSVMRKLKKKQYYRKIKEDVPNDGEVDIKSWQ